MFRSDVTRVLDAAARGDPHAAKELLPLVYEELRRLAAQRLSREPSERTLQATALVHERLVDVDGAKQQHWNGRGHFFAAAEAMRRTLIEQARARARLKRGGGLARVELDEVADVRAEPREELLALDEALSSLESADPLAADVVKLRYFAGLTVPQAAEALGIPLRTAECNWTYARTWLHRKLSGDAGTSEAVRPANRE